MKFLRKFFYVTNEKEEARADEVGTEEDEPNPFLTDFPEDDLDAIEDVPPESQDFDLDQADLDFVNDVVAHTHFTALTQGLDNDNGQIDLNAVLKSSGIDREAEEAGGEFTMEKVWALLQEGVPKESLPAIIKVSQKTVDEIVQDALRKGAVCDQFEVGYRQDHQASLEALTQEMTTIEQQTDAEIQQLKEETDMKIRELEERRQNVIEELRATKQTLGSKFDQDIQILDDYESQCAEVVKALKRS